MGRQGSLLAVFFASLAVLLWQTRHVERYGQLISAWTQRGGWTATATGSKQTADRWSLTTVTSAYQAYERSAQAETDRMRATYSRMSAPYGDLAGVAKYASKLDRLDEATRVNAAVTGAIADLALNELGVNGTEVAQRDGGSLFRTREALLHFVRDWSDEGADERNTIFKPILDVLRDVPDWKRGEMRVLVPGSGLGRLAWEISQLGYKATANELSWYMSLGLRFLLYPSTTLQVNQHTLQPFSHRSSNQRSNDQLFRSVSFPDVVPRYSTHFRLAEGDFLKQTIPAESEGYDVLVTQFFIDTGTNIVATLRQIHALLKPGGMWINLGPLLWNGGGSVMMELSLNEVLDLAKEVGFDLAGEYEPSQSNLVIPENTKRRTVECEYTADKMGMFQRIYHAEFWVATKR